MLFMCDYCGGPEPLTGNCKNCGAPSSCLEVRFKQDLSEEQYQRILKTQMKQKYNKGGILILS